MDRIGLWRVISIKRVATAFLLLATFSASLSGIAYSQSQGGEEDFILWSDSELGLEILYPAGWTADPDYWGVISFKAPAPELVDVILYMNEFPGNANLESVRKNIEDGYTSISENIQSFVVQGSTLSGYPAYRITMTEMYGDETEVRKVVVFTLHDKMVYRLIYQTTGPPENPAYVKYLFKVEAMFDSFRIQDTPDSTEQTNYLEYTSADLGFSVQYPSGWEIYDDPARIADDRTGFGHPNEKAGVWVYSYPFLSKDLEEFENSRIEQVTAGSLSTIIELNSTHLGDHPAKKLVWSQMLELVPGQLDHIQSMDVWTVVDNRMYQFTFFAEANLFAKYLPTIQSMIDSFEMDTSQFPKLLSGRYSNDDLQLEIDLPTGWVGMAIATGNLPTGKQVENLLIVMPLEQLGSNPSPPEESVAMMVFTSDISEIQSGMYGNTGTADACVLPETASIVSISQNPKLKALKSTSLCTIGESTETKVLTYILATDSRMINMIYFAGSKQAYDDGLLAFENSARSIRLQDNIDLSEPSTYPHGADFTVSKQPVTARGESYELEVVTNSNLTSFAFTEESKKLSFQVAPTLGNRGETLIGVGTVLSGPYAVTINGIPTKEGVMEIHDETINQTLISITRSEGIYDVSIVGTTVVPEFPLVTLLLVAVFGIAVSAGISMRLFKRPF